MSVLDNLKRHEKMAMEELQQRFEKILPPDIKDDDSLFYRFLKARDFDVDKADAFLKKHLDWRKATQVNNILKTFKPPEVCLKFAGPSVVGFGKDGNLVKYDAVGKKDPKDILKSVKINDLMKYAVWLIEKDVVRLKKQYKRTGKMCFQVTAIYDLDGITFAALTNKGSIDIFIRLINLVQDNYPECMKNVFIINAPAYYSIFFSILKRFMSQEMQQKFRVFGNNGWKEALLKVVDEEVLPAFLGGSKTDPDGNPLCESFILHGGRIPPKYFLSPEDRYFKDKNRVKSVMVSYADNSKIPVEVKECNSLIQWEFETKRKDIGFGLFFQKSEDELEEVLPIQKFVTADGTETGSFEALTVGTYIIVFDNSHSWLTSKVVYYCITVEAPNR